MPSRSGLEGDSRTRQGTTASADELLCCAKHLAVAASELARDQGTSPELAARFAAAETQYRSLVSAQEGILPEGERPTPPSPVVPIDHQAHVPLVVLLANLHDRERWWVTKCSVDPELVAGAKDLLCGIRWVFPGE